MALMLGASALASTTLLLEAENFEAPGGWVIDQQFMDEMGSPFLLAHGLGHPVQDAITTVTFKETGRYHVWVRTRDWVAPWKTASTPAAQKAKGTPGQFQVLIDGQALTETFGTQNAQWHWQAGGSVEIKQTRTRVALHDLTGFEGRCDAVLFARDKNLALPNRGEEMAAFRRSLLGLPEQAPDAGQYDLVVVGGGIAGICTSVTAASNGLKVALIQDRPVLGGNNSSEVRVWLHGARNGDQYPQIGNIVKKLEQAKRVHYGPGNTADLYEDEKKETLVRRYTNLDLFCNYRGNAVETRDQRIVAVVAQNVITAKRLRFPARYFADCTGDACIGFLAGADVDMTLAGHMGRCNLWNVKDTGSPVSFPRCPWALDLSDKPFPGRDFKPAPGGGNENHGLGGWYWESGFFHDPIKDKESIRDWNFRAMYGAWDAIKNTDKTHPTFKLNWAAHISGARESRRLMGDIVLTDWDLKNERQFDDGCVITGWKIDLHLPHPDYEKGFEGNAFIAKAYYEDYPTPYYLPYRILYSRNIRNLFMAGRNVSVTHHALGTSRVMRTCGLMGEVVGLAATLCQEHDMDPRDVYDHLLPAFIKLLKRGPEPTDSLTQR